MHRIIKLPDARYRISGPNVTSDIREDNFFESDIRHFLDIWLDSDKMSSKKKAYRGKDCNFAANVEDIIISWIYILFLDKKNQQSYEFQPNIFPDINIFPDDIRLSGRIVKKCRIIADTFQICSASLKITFKFIANQSVKNCNDTLHLLFTSTNHIFVVVINTRRKEICYQ